MANTGRSSRSFCHLLLHTRDGLRLPVLILVIQVRPVDDLVLLLRGDEVLDDQVPERQTNINQTEADRQQLNSLLILANK